MRAMNRRARRCGEGAHEPAVRAQHAKASIAAGGSLRAGSVERAIVDQQALKRAASARRCCAVRRRGWRRHRGTAAPLTSGGGHHRTRQQVAAGPVGDQHSATRAALVGARVSRWSGRAGLVTGVYRWFPLPFHLCLRLESRDTAAESAADLRQPTRPEDQQCHDANHDELGSSQPQYGVPPAGSLARPQAFREPKRWHATPPHSRIGAL